MGETRVTSTPVWQMVDFLGLDFPSEVNHTLVVKLNTGCVQNVVITWRCGLGRALLGTDAEDSFFPGTGHTSPTWMRSMTRTPWLLWDTRYS